jgi:hypothetical protein
MVDDLARSFNLTRQSASTLPSHLPPNYEVEIKNQHIAKVITLHLAKQITASLHDGPSQLSKIHVKMQPSLTK